MTIRTNIGEPIGIIGKTKALALALLMLAGLAAMVLSPTQAQASAYPGANGKIVFASNRTTGTGVKNPEGDIEIFTMNPDGTGLKQLTKNTAGDFNPTYSSDGKKIAFNSARAGNLDIFVMNAGGTGQTNLTTENTGSDFNPTFSPDGKKIAFETNRTGTSNIFVMNIDGSNPTNLTSNLFIAEDPAFSPKGDKIAFESNQRIFVMETNGSGQTPLTDTTSRAADPTFSPDGNKITFDSDRDGGGDPNKHDIYVMNADGSDPVRLTDNPARDTEPAFSPDGKKIAFVSTRDGDDEDIFVMNAGGTGQTDITPNTRSEINPDWQPIAATFTVTSDADPGDGVCNATCTLREAIDASNKLQSQIQNTIRFNISGGGVHTITPSTTLPPITSPVLIDGYTQPLSSPNTLTTGTNAALKIELNGTNDSGNGSGFNISGTSNSVIRGLIINRFSGSGILLGNTANNRIEGNFLGTDPTGTLARGNDNGVAFSGASRNVIGGNTPAARNLISGNTHQGIDFESEAPGNRILGNLIGTTATGSGALGNGFYGVALFGSNASNNKIGDGTSAGANTIAFNGRDGIEIDFPASTNGNTISRNSIFSNAGLGIDLLTGNESDTTNVSTPNDPDDADTGANNLQNFPVLSSAKTSSTTTTISATLNSTPAKTFKVQFFSNPSGNEGKKFIGQKSVTTNGSGDVSFAFSPASKVAVGQTITATATKSSTGDTSEFSASRTVASS